MAATDAPGDYLRDLHPKHEQFQKLRQALLKARAGRTQPEQAEAGSAFAGRSNPEARQRSIRRSRCCASASAWQGRAERRMSST